MIKPRNELLTSINEMYGENNDRNIFPYHIYYLRFPYFKNFKKNLIVHLNYPIVFITGTNGSGKSSFLHALYGSPDRYNIEDFWFETAMDPIIENKTDKNCFIAAFKTLSTKKMVEILKTRIKKEGNPEYWEPSRPVTRYHMEKLPDGDSNKERTKTRWRLQKRKVYYIDFRYMISAYDKFFYFAPEDRQGKKDILRKHAKRIARAFNDNSAETFYSRRVINKPQCFDQNTIKIISEILGKDYDSIMYSEHNLYSRLLEKGFVMKYNSSVKRKYSEAYAGSGETVIAKMVQQLQNVPEHSLILLDEPETSLHPQAQKKLIDYLLSLVIKKKVQVIVSTHAPDIIENMPNRAINMFYEENGKTCVWERVSFNDAFVKLGHNVTEKQIFVEDKLAQCIIEKVICREKHIGIFKVKPGTGGAQSLYHTAVEISKLDVQNMYNLILDGDQEPDISKDDVQRIIDSESVTREKLEETIKSITSIDAHKLHFNPNGNGGCDDRQKKKLMKLFLNFYIQHIYFLPNHLPEEIIYDNKYVDVLCGQFSTEEKNKIKGEDNYKQKFCLISQYKVGSNNSSDILMCEREFIEYWSKKETTEYEIIKKIINQLLS